MRRPLLVSLTAAVSLAVVGLAAATNGAPVAGAPTTTTVAPTTTVAAAAATTTTALGASTTAAPTTVPRGGSAEGSIAKPEPAGGWSIERLVTVTALGIVALAAAGYAFGRFRSTPPIHPDLARRPE